MVLVNVLSIMYISLSVIGNWYEGIRDTDTCHGSAGRVSPPTPDLDGPVFPPMFRVWGFLIPFSVILRVW